MEYTFDVIASGISTEKMGQFLKKCSSWEAILSKDGYIVTLQDKVDKDMSIGDYIASVLEKHRDDILCLREFSKSIKIKVVAFLDPTKFCAVFINLEKEKIDVMLKFGLDFEIGIIFASD